MPSAKFEGGAHARPRGSGFRAWRRARPFWGGLLVMLGGLEILLAVWAPLPVMMRVGMQGSIGYLIPAIIVICGALIVFTPGQRLLNSCVAMVLGLASWLTSNLGGFFIGMLLTLVGAAMAFAWRGSPAEEGPAAEEEHSADDAADDGEPVSSDR